MKETIKNLKKVYILGFIVLMIDQFIKAVVSTNLQINQSFILIKKFLTITLVHNTGAAFGIFEGGKIFFILIGVLAIILISLFIKNSEYVDGLSIFVYSLLLGGIFGNLVDRIIHGYVIDYISFNFLNYNFPIFNFADICIVVSIALIVISTLREDVWK